MVVTCKWYFKLIKSHEKCIFFNKNRVIVVKLFQIREARIIALLYTTFITLLYLVAISLFKKLSTWKEITKTWTLEIMSNVLSVSRYDSFILFLMALGLNIQNVYSIDSNLNMKQKSVSIPQLCELITIYTKKAI